MDNNPFLQHDPTSDDNTYQLILDLQTPISPHINILAQLKHINNAKSDEEIIQQLKYIQNHIENLDQDEFESMIDKNLCIELKQQIQEGKSAVQLEILNIILIIAERGAEMVKKYNENKFFQTFQESELLKRINIIFFQQIKILKDGKASQKFGELFSKLVLIVSFICKRNYIHRNILEACGNYFKFQINNLIQTLRNLINQQDLEEQQRKQQIENEKKKGIRIINVISYFAENWSNQQYLAEFIKIHENIAPLLHIRCPELLNCNQSLNLPESESTNQLLSSVYKSLSLLFTYFQSSQQFLLDNHNIFQHLTPLIIQFPTRNSHQTRISNQIQHTSNSSYPASKLSLITESLNLVWSLLFGNTSLCQTAYSTPNLIKQLIYLAGFERKQHKSIKIEKQNSQIRLQSDHCLDRICSFGDEIVKKRILNEFKYMRIQTEFIGTGGGSEEQNDGVIECGLTNINNFFFNFHKMNDDKFNTQTHLIKTANEQLEDDGGLEEIESNFFHWKQSEHDNFQYLSKSTKKLINNIKKDPTNDDQNN